MHKMSTESIFLYALMATVFTHICFSNAPWFGGKIDAILGGVAIIVFAICILREFLWNDKRRLLCQKNYFKNSTFGKALVVCFGFLAWAIIVHGTIELERWPSTGPWVASPAILRIIIIIFSFLLMISTAYFVGKFDKTVIVTKTMILSTTFSALFALATFFFPNIFLDYWVKLAFPTMSGMSPVISTGRVAGFSPGSAHLSFLISVSVCFAVHEILFLLKKKKSKPLHFLTAVSCLTLLLCGGFLTQNRGMTLAIFFGVLLPLKHFLFSSLKICVKLLKYSLLLIPIAFVFSLMSESNKYSKKLLLHEEKIESMPCNGVINSDLIVMRDVVKGKFICDYSHCLKEQAPVNNICRFEFGVLDKTGLYIGLESRAKFDVSLIDKITERKKFIREIVKKPGRVIMKSKTLNDGMYLVELKKKDGSFNDVLDIEIMTSSLVFNSGHFHSRVSFRDNAIKNRISSFKKILCHALNHPLGIGLYVPEADVKCPSWIPFDEMDRKYSSGLIPHNQFLLVLSEYGFIGLFLLTVLYLFVFKSILFSAKRLFQKDNSGQYTHIVSLVYSSIIAYTVFNMFVGYSLFSGDWFCAIFLGMVFGLERIAYNYESVVSKP